MQNVYRWYFLTGEQLAHTFAIKSISIDEALEKFSAYLNSNRKEYLDQYRRNYIPPTSNSLVENRNARFLLKPFRIYKEELKKSIEVFNFKGDTPEGYVYSGDFPIYKPDLTKMITL